MNDSLETSEAEALSPDHFPEPREKVERPASISVPAAAPVALQHADHCGIFDERNGCTCAPTAAPVAKLEPLPKQKLDELYREVQRLYGFPCGTRGVVST